MRNGSTARAFETGEELVRLYLQDISRYPLLTRDDEVRLARRIETGMAARAELEAGKSRAPDSRRRLEERARDGELATQEFVNANLRLVVSIARTYRASGLSLLDLVQEGNLGLMHAVEKFEWRKGFKFSTYATWWIRQAINRGLAHSGRTIRLPLQAGERLTRLFKAGERLEARLGRTPSLEELAAETNMSTQDVERALRSCPHVLSLSAPTGAQARTEIGEIIADENAPEPFEQAARSLTVAEVERVLDTLEPQERRVLRLRFGLDGATACTFRELAAQLDMPREKSGGSRLAPWPSCVTPAWDTTSTTCLPPADRALQRNSAFRPPGGTSLQRAGLAWTDWRRRRLTWPCQPPRHPRRRSG